MPAAPVKNVGELLADPQFQASGMTAEDAEGRLYGALPLRWNGARPPASGRLPDPDADAAEILDELAVSADLRSAVLGDD